MDNEGSIVATPNKWVEPDALGIEMADPYSSRKARGDERAQIFQLYRTTPPSVATFGCTALRFEAPPEHSLRVFRQPTPP